MMNHDAAATRSCSSPHRGAFLAQFRDVVVVARLAPARCEDPAGTSRWNQGTPMFIILAHTHRRDMNELASHWNWKSE